MSSPSPDDLTEVTLVLGGGGAKGFVHLGVIEELVRRDIQIRAIVGTSIGAIIGSLFAHYVSELYSNERDPQAAAIGQLIDVMISLSFWRHADLNLVSAFRRGIVRGESIDSWLSQRLSHKKKVRAIRFDELDFDLTVTATDAHTGESLILNRDEEPKMFVHSAVRASMSMPWIFKEIELEIDGKPIKCWDGGTTGNCRFDIAARLYPDRPIIASSLTYRGEVVDTGSGLFGIPFRPLKVLNHSTSILMRSFEEALKQAMPSDQIKQIIFLEPSLSIGSTVVNTYYFQLALIERSILIENGRAAVELALGPQS